jgi:pimeloyl-ACP methyl ester carboxylesterase
MKWQTDGPVQIVIEGCTLEGYCWGAAPGDAPTLVLLHEGLGSARLWKDLPGQLAQQTGYGVFAYSRTGYGKSDPVSLPRPLDYMTREAVDVLPQVLEAIGFRRGVLLGHSDGASIAAIYAGSVEDMRIRGLCLLSPHFFTEPEGLAAIGEAKVAFEAGDLRARLARHHEDPDNTFRGWNDAWLDPGFKDWNIEEVISYLRIPVLALQGREDQYGTLAQIEALKNGLYSPLDVEVLDHCQHSPHIEQRQKTLFTIVEYLARLDRIEAVVGEVK